MVKGTDALDTEGVENVLRSVGLGHGNLRPSLKDSRKEPPTRSNMQSHS